MSMSNGWMVVAFVSVADVAIAAAAAVVVVVVAVVLYSSRWCHTNSEKYAHISFGAHSCVRRLWSTGKGICRRLYLSSFLLSIRNIFAGFLLQFLFAVHFSVFVNVMFFSHSLRRCFSVCFLFFFFFSFDQIEVQNIRYKNPHFLLQNNKTVKCNYKTLHKTDPCFPLYYGDTEVLFGAH